MATNVLTAIYPFTHSEAVAWHVHEDLLRVVESRGVELSDVLGIPEDERVHPDPELLELLCDDLAHLVRDGLVSRVHLLVHELDREAGTGAFPLLHRATYEVVPRGEPSLEATRRMGGLLRTPDLESGGFAMLVHWYPCADPEQRERVTRPGYNLSWLAPEGRQDRLTLVRYREGSFTAEGAEIVSSDEDGCETVVVQNAH